MADSQTPGSPRPKPAPEPEGDVEAYEVEEKKPEPRAKPGVNRSYAVEVEAPGASPQAPSLEDDRLMRAKKMLGMGEGGRPTPVKEVDPAKAAAQRLDARKRNAELWAQEEAAARRKRLIVTAIALLALAAAGYFLFIRR